MLLASFMTVLALATADSLPNSQCLNSWPAFIKDMGSTTFSFRTESSIKTLHQLPVKWVGDGPDRNQDRRIVVLETVHPGDHISDITPLVLELQLRQFMLPAFSLDSTGQYRNDHRLMGYHQLDTDDDWSALYELHFDASESENHSQGMVASWYLAAVGNHRPGVYRLLHEYEKYDIGHNMSLSSFMACRKKTQAYSKDKDKTYYQIFYALTQWPQWPTLWENCKPVNLTVAFRREQVAKC